MIFNTAHFCPDSGAWNPDRELMVSKKGSSFTVFFSPGELSSMTTAGTRKTMLKFNGFGESMSQDSSTGKGNDQISCVNVVYGLYLAFLLVDAMY